MDNNFKNGFFAGLFVSSIAVLACVYNKEGQALGREIKKDFNLMVEKTKEGMQKFHKKGKEEFDELAETFIGEYAKKKEMDPEGEKELVELLKSKWKEIEKDYLEKKS